ncbi:MAG: hypothetical protein NTX22_17375 [Ignavibacteriales bacterium]|nr:hypothetical protein [Ignavibacteriales bacterium]
MKRINLIAGFFLSAVIYFTGCYPFNTGVYKDYSTTIIYYPPDPQEPCDCDPVPPPEPPPVSITVPIVKYRPIQPVNQNPEKTDPPRKRIPGITSSRDNDGGRNENLRRR